MASRAAVQWFKRTLKFFGRFWNREITSPPYNLLPLAVFAYAVIAFIFHPQSAIRTGALADTDDYMRLNETINWLSGQNWLDLSHPRLSPGSYTVVHWARLLDIPLALLMLPFVKLMGIQNAALLASFIVPPATLGILLWLSAQLARPFVGTDRANLATLLTLFAPFTLMNFVPGRVDHHGYEVLVAGFGLLAIERMAVRGKKGDGYAIAAAVVFACGLWIGTEALPWALLFIACLGIMAAWAGEMLLRRAALFGAAFAVATMLILPLAVTPVNYPVMALSWFSMADVLLATLISAAFTIAWLTGHILKKRWMRVGIMAACGTLALAIFCIEVPEVGQGPFADYDDFDSTIALANIGEAQPLIHGLHFNSYNMPQTIASMIAGIQTLFLPLLALAVISFAVWRKKRGRELLFVHGAFLAAALVLTLFWQIRVGWFMQFFAIAPLTYLMVEAWKKIAVAMQERSRFVAEIAVFLLLGFIPTVFIPALAHNAPFTDVVFFPAARGAQACPLQNTANFLSEPWALGATRHTIISGSNEGPELLFRTPHDVIAANFNVAGNEDVYNFFGARDDASAKSIAQKWHADLVLICRSFPRPYARLDHIQFGKTAFLSPDADGKIGLISNPDHPTLIEHLVRGSAPAWLKPVEIPGDKDYLLFEVKK